MRGSEGREGREGRDGRDGKEGSEESEGAAEKLKTGSFSTWSWAAGRARKLRLLSGAGADTPVARAGAGLEEAVRSTLLRPESATFDFILRLDLAWLVGSIVVGVGVGVGVSVPVLSDTELVVVVGGGLTTSLWSLFSVLVVVEGLVLTAGPGLALVSLPWL